MIVIKGLDKAMVFKALYDNAKTQGLGVLHYDSKPMDIKEAKKLVKGNDLYFDYVKGRVMKVDLKNDDSFDEWLYDRDNGIGSAKKCIDSLRE